MIKTLLRRTLRIVCRMVWYASLIAFVVSLLPLLINPFFGNTETGKELLNKFIREYAPSVRVDYDKAAVKISFSGTFIEVSNVAIRLDETTVLQVPRALLSLKDDTLKIALKSPQANLAALAAFQAIPTDSAAANNNVSTVIITATHANLVFDNPPLTLNDANVALRYNNNNWTINLHENAATYNFHINAVLDEALHGVARTEFSGASPPYAPFVWRHADLTLRTTIGDTLAATAQGNWQFDLPQQTVTAAFSLAGQYDQPTGEWAINQASVKVFNGAITLSSTFAAGGNHSGVNLVGGAARVDALPLAALSNYAAMADYLPDSPENITLNIAAIGTWEKHSDDSWTLSGKKLHLFNDETVITAALAATGNNTTLTSLHLNGNILDTPMTAIHRYLPAGEVRDWFANSILGGTMTDAAFLVTQANGLEQTQQAIKLTAAFSDGVIFIDDGWPQARGLAGVVVVDGDDIRVEGEGLYGDLPASDVIATIPNATAEKATLFLAIKGATRPLLEHLTAAKQTPATAADVNEALRTLTPTDGRAMLSLAVAIPLAAPQNSTVQAALGVKHVSLETEQTPPLQNIAGVLHINNDGIIGNLNGQFLSTQLNAPKMTINFTNTAMTVSGEVDTAVILSVVKLPPLPISGTVDFRLTRSPSLTVFSSSLQSALIDLPAPMGKNALATSPLSVRLDAQQTAVIYQNTNNTVQMLFVKDAADIALNTPAQPPPKTGINIRGSAADVDIDKWLSLETDDDSDTPTAFLLTLNNATLLGNSHTELRIDSPAPQNNRRIVNLVSPNLQGSLTIAGNRINAHFDRLLLAGDNDKNDADSYSFPMQLTLSASIATVISDTGLTLGAVQLYGEPDNDTWKLSTLHITNGDTVLNASGVYDGDLTNLTLQMESPDLPNLLASYGVPDVIGEGHLSLIGSIGWPQSPADFDKTALKGRLRVSATNLRYLEISSGAGIVNLLAIFSPQSLISFGFTDIMKSGIAFKTVVGDIILDNGLASSDSINLVSDDLQMNILGDTDYVNKQHNLRGRVRPGEKLLKAAGVVGVGTGAIALQPLSIFVAPIFGNFLDGPISEIGAYEYTITGDWDNPIYTENEKPAAEPKPKSAPEQ